jgi:hypothetical protein
MRRIRRAGGTGPAGIAAVLAVAAAIFAAGCGGGSPAVEVSGVGVNPELRLADCTDWENSSTEERLVTLQQLQNFSGGQADTPAGRGPKLGEDQGYDLLETYCERDSARAFKLYKLYERAAAFGGY